MDGVVHGRGEGEEGERRRTILQHAAKTNIVRLLFFFLFFFFCSFEKKRRNELGGLFLELVRTKRRIEIEKRRKARGVLRTRKKSSPPKKRGGEEKSLKTKMEFEYLRLRESLER